MRLSLIAAFSDNHVLGRDNQLVWELPDDWANFRRVTGDAPFITGRKSYEAPDRLLSPGRNLILTRRTEPLPEPNCEPVASLDAALERVGDAPEVFVTGGASVFAHALPRIDYMYLTIVHDNFVGDAWFPPIDWSQWEPVRTQFHPADERHAVPFHLNEYRRIGATTEHPPS